MRYEQIGSGSYYPYPNHDINPAKKGHDWCMAYAKAAYYDWSFAYPKGVFANNSGDYEKNRMYALGKQPITPYRKYFGVDEQTNNTWLSVDWTVRPIVSTYRDKAISRLMKQDYSFIATPIDILAKSELDEYYSDMKAKLAIRQLMMQQNPELASHPLITLQSGEPLDIEELEMRVELGEQFNRSKDAELAIELGMYENNYTSCRRAIYEDLFDYGVAGFKHWLGDDNKPKFRRVNPQSVVTNFCRTSTFEDLIHAGEVIDVPLIELAQVKDKDGNLMFNEAQLQEFAASLAGKYGNPPVIGRSSGWLKPYDKFKCRVLDLEFYTYNEYSYRDVNDEYGNSDFRKMDYDRGKKSDKFKRRKIQCVYKVKWIVGTQYCYDFGMAYDQIRAVDIKRKAKTKLSYYFCAYNFYDMKAQSFMDRLIPYLDDYQLTMLKIQNFKNRAVPSGWWINLDALEHVALSKGGADMEPKDLLQMFYETGVLVGRSLDGAGNPLPHNIQPVIPISNTVMSELAGFYQDLLNTVIAIEKMTGYNDITSGNPNPKTLVPGYELANMSTNDALYPLAWAEETLSTKLAEAVMDRTQQGIRKGGISGYAKSINSNSLKFIEVSPDVAFRDYGILVEKRTTDDQRMWLLQQMQADIQNGFLSTSDAALLVNTHNTKQAMSIWSYRVKKAKEQAQQYEMQKIQLNNQGASEAAQVAAQLEQQKLQMEWQFRLQEEQMRIMGELKKEEMRLSTEVQLKQLELGVKAQMNTELSEAKVESASIAGEAKVISQQIANQGKAISDSISAEAAIEKQQIANKKPQSGAKK